MSLGEDFGMTFHAKVSSDASAAIGMVNRTGAGKLRHIRVQYLWIQDVVKSGQLGLEKVPGTDNPADVFTKHVDAHTMRKHFWRLGYEVSTTRAATAPTLHTLLGMISWHGDNEGCIQEGGNEKFYEENNDGKEYIAEKYNLKNMKCRDRDEDSRRGPGQLDDWSRDGAWMIRTHERPRLELFTPLRVAGSPPAKNLTPTRVTRGKFDDNGESFEIVDTWTARPSAHRALSRSWTGSTLFLIKAADKLRPVVQNEPFYIPEECRNSA
jgi:hypothetical protein